MTERLHENEARVEELTKNWTSKWRETQKIIEVKKKINVFSRFLVQRRNCEIPVMSLIGNMAIGIEFCMIAS